MPLVTPDPSDAKYRFQAPTGQRTSVMLSKIVRLALVDVSGDPITATPSTLSTPNGDDTANPDAQGKVEFHVSKKTSQGRLEVEDTESGFEVDAPLKIGTLPDAGTDDGQKVRLRNLGYFFGRVPGLDPDDAHDDPQDFRSAVEEFQCDQSLPVTGDCDGTTQAKLKDVHGS
jgi:hypothetical protein